MRHHMYRPAPSKTRSKNMKRFKVKKRKDKKYYSATAAAVHPKNLGREPQRGGYRI